jgi:hypothetical protein
MDPSIGCMRGLVDKVTIFRSIRARRPVHSGWPATWKSSATQCVCVWIPELKNIAAASVHDGLQLNRSTLLLCEIKGRLCGLPASISEIYYIIFYNIWSKLLLQFIAKILLVTPRACLLQRYYSCALSGSAFQQQQQQQHSLLSQASWGRLEIKPKRDEKQGDT